MKLHKVYTSRGSIETRIGIPNLVLVMYFFKHGISSRNRLRKFYSSIKEFDKRVTKDDFT